MCCEDSSGPLEAGSIRPVNHHRKTNRPACRQTGSEASRQADKQISRPASMQASRPTVRYKGRQAGIIFSERNVRNM